MTFKIDNVEFIPIKPHSGLVGFVSCEIDGLYYIGGLGVYTNLNRPGFYRVTYPCKKLGNGELVKLFSPLSEALNQAITEAINLKVQDLLDSDYREEVSNHANSGESK